MPAYIRLLAYFSNFILLASFLGIGVGCLLAPSRRRLFVWFPLLQAIVVAAVYFFRLEVAVPAAGSIYFTSGTADDVVCVESTMLLPLVFVIVAALFATLAQRMGREMAALPPLRGYTLNLLGSLAGVVAFGGDLVAAAVADVVVRGRRSPRRCRCSVSDRLRARRRRPRRPESRVTAVNVVLLGRVARARARAGAAARSGRRTTRSPSARKARTRSSR